VIDALIGGFATAQQALFEAVVQPITFALGFGAFVEQAFDATAWLLIGLIQIAIIALVFVPLQRRYPVEPIVNRATVRTDMFYTALHRLGLFRLALFFTLTPLADDAFGWLRAQGMPTFHADQLWPGVTDVAWVSFVVYLVLFDFVDYWLHRGQHHFNWWWQLHSLHHAQTQMTAWSDNRNHLLDDAIRDFAFAAVALIVGVAPAQFVALVAITQLAESLQHANIRKSFGAIGERLLVSPRFHRTHHAIGIGHETTPGAKRGGHNFAVLFPVWDVIFRTANFELNRYDPTGVRDQAEQGRNYGRGFLSQQWLGLKRLVGSA
jgi:sterol desaturase/sphingolipid hydroxylase (fatty acid hydroxylase superfamily)